MIEENTSLLIQDQWSYGCSIPTRFQNTVKQRHLVAGRGPQPYLQKN